MKYKSEIYEVIHHDAVALFEVGAISEAELWEFEKMCLVEEPEPVYEVKKNAVIEQVTA